MSDRKTSMSNIQCPATENPAARNLTPEDLAIKTLATPRIAIEVAYALPNKQKIITMMVEQGTTAYDAVRRSGIEKHFVGMDLDTAVMGIFGQAFGTKGLNNAKEYLLQPRDRIEIYRPLTADPKVARRRRADRNKEKADKGHDG